MAKTVDNWIYKQKEMLLKGCAILQGLRYFRRKSKSLNNDWRKRGKSDNNQRLMDNSSNLKGKI